VLELIKKHNIKDYFFLDSSFPMIYKLSNEGEKNIAIRFSEFEGIDTILNMKDKVNWVWVDCFTKMPLDYNTYINLKKAGFKLCFVSPELQNQPEKIKEYKEYFKKENIVMDMICTKSYNIEKWNNTDVQIIIPMSGLGQRFVEEGYRDPKPLIIVDGKHIIEHVVNLFPNEQDITFICNDKHLKETNMREVLLNISSTCKIYEVPTEGREGPVQAVSLIYDNIDDDKEVIVSYCDYGSHWNYAKFLSDSRNRNADGAIACYKGFHPHMLGTDNYAFLKETETGTRWMSQIQEKQPFTNNKMSEYASNGTYYFKTGAIMKKYFKILMDKQIKVKNEYYVSMVYNLLLEDGLNVNIFEIEHMLQWGTPYDLEIYNDWSNYFNNILVKQPIYNDIYNTTLILPMAGAGSRFSTKGYLKPKPLLDICNAPMIVQAVNCLPETTNKVFICLEEHLKNYDINKTLEETYNNCNIISINKITDGQACTTEIGINETNLDLENPILISACDNGVYYNKEKYQKLLEDETIDVIVWSFTNNPTSKNNPNMYAWLETDENNNIKSVSCKKFNPDIHNIKTSHVIIGTMFFRKAKYFMDGLSKNYEQNIRSNGEFYVDDVINQNILNGLNVKVFEVENYICWGTPDDYETYLYWQSFFNKCSWHKYKIENDITNKI
jgi:NDP-sugar pyrophosphorylase family protein